MYRCYHFRCSIVQKSPFKDTELWNFPKSPAGLEGSKTSVNSRGHGQTLDLSENKQERKIFRLVGDSHILWPTSVRMTRMPPEEKMHRVLKSFDYAIDRKRLSLVIALMWRPVVHFPFPASELSHCESQECLMADLKGDTIGRQSRTNSRA